MGQIEKTIKLTREIESLLEELGATGKGLHDKISSIESDLDEPTVKSLRWIATLRNKVVHEQDFVIENFTDYRSTCKKRIAELKKKAKSKRCYIATAVYGDSNCEQVVLLRQFRDRYLETNWWGKCLVQVYYCLSPILARQLNPHFFVSRRIRKYLDLLVGYIERTNR